MRSCMFAAAVLASSLFVASDAQTLEVQAAGNAADPNCDITFPGALCVFGGKKVILPDAAAPGLTGRWTFDEVKPLDASGNGNHALHAIPAAPGAFGQGASASFNGFDYVEIPDASGKLAGAMDGDTFSVSFWMFLPQNTKELIEANERNGKNLDCPIFQKGDDTRPSPAITINPSTRKLKVLQKTDDTQAHESFSSRGVVRTNSWVHVALVRKDGEATLYLNGVPDNAVKFKATPASNKDSVFIGNTPGQKDICHIVMYIDDVQTFNTALDEDMIAAAASPALGGIEPAFSRLGCQKCGLEKAKVACPDGYHLCSAMELHTGGYQIARLNGYTDFSTRVWTQKEAKDTSGAIDRVYSDDAVTDSGTGTGMCCMNSW